LNNSLEENLFDTLKGSETEGLEDIIPMPEYKIEMPDEKLIKCLRLINLKADGKITKRDLKDAAMKAGLIHVDKERITAK